MRQLAQTCGAVVMNAFALAAGAQPTTYEPVKWYPLNNGLQEFTGQQLPVLIANQLGGLLTKSQSRSGTVWTFQPVQLAGNQSRALLGTPATYAPDVRIFTLPSMTYPHHLAVLTYTAVGLYRESASNGSIAAASTAPPVVQTAIPVHQLAAVMAAFSFRAPAKPATAQMMSAVANIYSEGLKYGLVNEINIVWLDGNNRLMTVGKEMFLTDGSTKLRTWPASDFVLLRPDRQVAVIRFLGLTK